MIRIQQDGQVDAGRYEEELAPAPSAPLISRRVLWIAAIVCVSIAGATWAASWGLAEMANRAALAANTHTVTRGAVILTFAEKGALESESNLDVKCRVRSGGSSSGGMPSGGGSAGGGRSGGGGGGFSGGFAGGYAGGFAGGRGGGTTILWLLPDGSQVKKGDELVRLDTSKLDEDIRNQTISVERARSAELAAERALSAAKVAVEEYINGAYRAEIQTLDSRIRVAQENLYQAEQKLAAAAKLARQGYVTDLQVGADQFGVERAQLDLAAAETARRVLDEHTKQKTLESLEGAVSSAEATLKASIESLALEEERLRRAHENLANSVVYAPQDGMVVHANFSGGMGGPGMSSTGALAIEEGATVRDQQTIMQLPDLSRMQAVVGMHESKIERVKVGMKARIKIGRLDYTGTVTKVATQPVAVEMIGGKLFKYPVTIRINGKHEGLRPGMSADTVIEVAELRDVVTVPVAAVVEEDDQYYCYVRGALGNFSRRPVVIGTTDDKVIEIKDGLSEGEVVLLRPRTALAKVQSKT